MKKHGVVAMMFLVFTLVHACGADPGTMLIASLKPDYSSVSYVKIREFKKQMLPEIKLDLVLSGITTSTNVASDWNSNPVLLNQSETKIEIRLDKIDVTTLVNTSGRYAEDTVIFYHTKEWFTDKHWTLCPTIHSVYPIGVTGPGKDMMGFGFSFVKNY